MNDRIWPLGRGTQTLVDKGIPGYYRSPDGTCMIAAKAGGCGAFLTNPPRDTRLATGDILIVVGTDEQLAGLRREAGRVGTA